MTFAIISIIYKTFIFETILEKVFKWWRWCFCNFYLLFEQQYPINWCYLIQLRLHMIQQQIYILMQRRHTVALTPDGIFCWYRMLCVELFWHGNKKLLSVHNIRKRQITSTLLCKNANLLARNSFLVYLFFEREIVYSCSI